MSFVVVAALAIAALVAGPIAAHLLRRGRARQHMFPPAAIVPEAPPAARRRSRLEDRTLLLLRGLIVLALATLGATPLVRCSHLSVHRRAGASVALALVLDDSLSMQARVQGETSRWALAVDGAHELLESMRDGDAVSVILAGGPARLALGGTTNLKTADRVLAQLAVSDRSTDLAGALSLAATSLDAMPHTDRRVVVFSDLAVAELPKPARPVWVPIPELRRSADNCGITRAERGNQRIVVEVTCNNATAATGRQVHWTPAAESPPKAKEPPPSPARADNKGRSAALAQQKGTQSIMLVAEHTGPVDVVLTGRDTVPRDDHAPVAPRPRTLSVAVVADPTLSAVSSGPTVIEQGLRALSEDIVVRPLPMLPEDPQALADHAALIVDDISGISPEARVMLSEWLTRGGVAAAFFGPRASAVPLGSTLEPFLSGAVRWESIDSGGITAGARAWLGDAGASLVDLSPRGRLRFDGAILAQGRVLARWQDDAPFSVQTRVGQGVALALGLPSSVHTSDLALRPGFLGILDYVLSLASRRRGAQISRVGAPWYFESSDPIAIMGPSGPLPARRLHSPQDLEPPGLQQVAIPGSSGRYWLTVAGQRQQRIVTIDPQEVLRQPKSPWPSSVQAGSNQEQARVDASPTVAWLLIALLGAELVLRIAVQWRSRQAPAVSGAGSS